MSAERPTRSQCETCGGTGRVQSGDDRDWTTCPDCEPDGKTSDLKGLTAAIGWGLDPTGSTKDPLLGTKIHDVTIVRVLAEGGMGRVYEGLQDKPRRPVAVKIIKPGCVSQEAIRRFEFESEMLGRLNHASIAHVHSAGIHTLWGGQVPYFVMEYIDGGLPLTAYAKKHGKSPSERLELFCKVCDAVAYGHEQTPSIVHRDLKPSNILVNRSGNPKVIDFGIARCVEGGSDVAAAMTTTGQIIGSVQYMSPEQFAGNPKAIDSRTDVWALGVILHELLAETLPYDVRGMNVVEAWQIVSQFQPTWSDELMRRMGPQLLGIIEKCLRQDRDDRFADAGALSAAIATLPAEKPFTVPRTGSSAAKTPSAVQPGFNRRTALLAGGTAAAIVGAALTDIEWLMKLVGIERPAPDPVKSSAPSTQLFVFNGRRYAIVLAPVTRAEALAEADRRKGHLAQIDTTAQRKAVRTAAIEAYGGPVYLWADCRMTGDGADGGFSAISIVPPTDECVRLDGATVAGGFVCDLGE